ncbi:MAG: hypothetical protein KDC44_05100, partial [Phaeodactylibacter sp.]|nr:hypothetical protein [Phaeodactylibacter sp.]
MRFRCLFLLCAGMGLSAQISAQVLDNTINFQVWVDNFYSNADNDTQSMDDISISTSFWSQGGWSSIYCTQWQCNAPCINPNDLYMGGALFTDFEEAIKIAMAGWENDGGDGCTYDPGIDDFFFFDEYDALPYCQVTYNRQPGLFYKNYNPTVNENWLFPGSVHDINIKTVWRYSQGFACSNPLQFGVIPNGQSRNHQNANRSFVSSYDNYPVGYYQAQNSTSGDVYYSFVISQTAEVTISTDHPETDYDTRLYLYGDNCSAGALIAENDDIGAGNYNSQITQVLCPGPYLILVEGYEQNEGYFKLSVGVAEPEVEGFIGLQLTDPQCPSSNDGSIDLGQPVGGGGPPYSIYWQNGETGPLLENLSEGTYFVTV